MFLVIDNFDSFVHNLARLLRLAGAETKVIRNDSIMLEAIEALAPEAIVLSPGPGEPADAGCCVEVVRRFAGRLPILGVCLGHQAIVAAYGGQIVRGTEPLHGRTSSIRHNGNGLFAGLPSPLTVCRYHSLVADPVGLPTELQTTATADDGTIMAVQHERHSIYGVQFHPEAILTEEGQRLLTNFVRLTTVPAQPGG